MACRPARSTIWSTPWVPPSGIKKSEVSRICAGLDETVGAFRARRLDHVEFPYVYLDATYLHVATHGPSHVDSCRHGHRHRRRPASREVLGVAVGDSEDETFWPSFLRTLKGRGLVLGCAW